MGHFGVSGLKEVVLSDKFKIKVPVTKEEGKIRYDDQSGLLEKKTILDPLKLEKDEKAKDMIIFHIGNQVLRKMYNIGFDVVIF